MLSNITQQLIKVDTLNSSRKN